MKNLKSALTDLENIVNTTILQYNLPVEKGNTLRIGNMIVRNSKRFGYVIVDANTNKSVDRAYSKYGAVALANAHIKKLSIKQIKRCDEIIEKNINDSYFYVNSLKNTDDELKQAILESRLEIAQSNINNAKYFLDEFILKHIR
jgi:hypothetical protein